MKLPQIDRGTQGCLYWVAFIVLIALAPLVLPRSCHPSTDSTDDRDPPIFRGRE